MNKDEITRKEKNKRSMLLLAVILLAFPAFIPVSREPKGKPLIGITGVFVTSKRSGGQPRVCLNYKYAEEIAEAGGVPVVIPPVPPGKGILETIVQRLDGLLLSGGADIPPEAYNEKPDEKTKTMPRRRFEFEHKLIPLWLNTGKPTLGICLGLQFANVAMGGSLFQDIPSQVGTKVIHRKKGGAHHYVFIYKDTLLWKILGKNKVKVYSNHHQAAKRVAGIFRVSARAEDGVVEAMERRKGGFGLFLQWHPEQMKDKEHKRRIFGAFVKACMQGEAK